MKRLAAAVALALAACAHGASSGGPAQPHAPLTLVGPTGLDEQQDSMLEGTLCQALVEANHGDVTCPSSIRAALALSSSRDAISGERASGEAVVAEVNKAERQVQATVTHPGRAFELTLVYLEASGAAPKATRTVHADDFEELVQKAPDAAKALLP